MVLLMVLHYVLFIQSVKDKQITTLQDQDDDTVSDDSKKLSTFLSRMLNFGVKLEEAKVWLPDNP